MSGAMSGTKQSMASGTVSPPIPGSMYYVAADGKSTGPFDIPTLKNMALSGQFSASSLVWKQGMSEWLKAENIEELKNMFSTIPPVPPVK